MRAAVRLVAASPAAVVAVQAYALVTVTDDEEPDRDEPVVRTFRLGYTDPADAVAEADDHDLFVLNAGAGHSAPGIWRDWLAYADGAMEEHRAGFEAGSRDRALRLHPQLHRWCRRARHRHRRSHGDNGP